MGERQLGGGTPKWKPKELSGKEIVDFWNNVEHPPMKKISMIGGEPTLHKDFAYVINNLDGYYITVTSNCGSPFYKNKDFVEKLRTKPTSHLRMNTSFHPDFITPERYVEVVKMMKEAGIHVDQTSFVATPVLKKHTDKLKSVNKDLPLRADVFLGFWNEEEGFEASFDPANAWPREGLPSHYKKMTGINNFKAYREACLQTEKTETDCDVVYNNMLVDPSGMVYHCHYKMYNELDPVCHISDFKPITDYDRTCRHYGFCLSCDAPSLQKELVSTPVILNKFYSKKGMEEREVAHLALRLKGIADAHDLNYNNKILFESANMYLYSGHKHSGYVLYHGDLKHPLLRYLSSKKYKITHQENKKLLEKKYDIAMLSNLQGKVEERSDIITRAANSLQNKGILMFTMDVGTRDIPSKKTVIDTFVTPLLEEGFVWHGGRDETEGVAPDDSKHQYILVTLRNERG
tara:strand:+ start:987 stop:2369 length:1383 start_codon:yes stop_codon:yes gene_type:complete